MSFSCGRERGKERERDGGRAGVALFSVLYCHSFSIIFLKYGFTSPDSARVSCVSVSVSILGYCFLYWCRGERERERERDRREREREGGGREGEKENSSENFLSGKTLPFFDETPCLYI